MQRATLADRPAHRRGEIRDADEMHTRRLRHLREIHGAELAGADQADAKRFALCRALGEFRVQVHFRPALMLRKSTFSGALREPGELAETGVPAVGAFPSYFAT